MSPEMAGTAFNVLERATALMRAGQDFVMATVVWREEPSSGQVGSRAIITADGETYGFIGGACAEPVLIREALEAIRDGQPRLLLLGVNDEGHLPPGMTVVPLSCQSDGALHIFVEPIQAAPHLVVVGRSPMAHTLINLASSLDWRTDLVDGSDFPTDRVGPTSIVIVATQGHGDEQILEHLATVKPKYVGVVASRSRGDFLRGVLLDQGVNSDWIDQLQAPVGIDLGKTSHREVAVSVIAELVRLRSAGALNTRRGVAPRKVRTQAVDPICGMTVQIDPSTPKYQHNDRTLYFCCTGCLKRFQSEPATHSIQEATC